MPVTSRFASNGFVEFPAVAMSVAQLSLPLNGVVTFTPMTLRKLAQQTPSLRVVEKD